jgi:glyoxylase-like metal-dependent hydrolase (beta-lactamase superfamily II)
MLLVALIAVGALSIGVAGYQAGQGRGEGRGRGPQGPNVAEIEKVRDNLYMLTGGGGNTAVFITDGGVTLVDTKLANWGQAILDKVKTVTNKPITTIINTHTHGDHNGSNEFFGATVEFVAQENTKTNMEKMDAFKGDKSVFLPKKTFKDKLTIGKGKEEIELFYFGRAHTNGDAWVLFKEDRVLHSGDAFAGKTTPIIDGNNGGSAIDYGKTLAKAYSAIGKSADTIITGHSPLMKPADLTEYAAFNNEFGTWVAAQKKAGKSVDDAAAAYKIPDKYPGYQINTFLGGIKNNIQVAYGELK